MVRLMEYALTIVVLQDLPTCSVLVSGSQHQCVASNDSILDYGQYAISRSGLGNNMYSTATAQSTMDYSVLPIDAGVVDSPHDDSKRRLPISSPSH